MATRLGNDRSLGLAAIFTALTGPAVPLADRNNKRGFGVTPAYGRYENQELIPERGVDLHPRLGCHIAWYR